MKKISRRDFLRASAVMASGLMLSPEEALARKVETSDSVKRRYQIRISVFMMQKICLLLY